MNQNNTDISDRILYEDNHLIIVNKLSGELVQGDNTGDIPLLEKVREYIKVKYQKPGNVFCGLVHRIDRPVSGAVVFAKTSKALARMNEKVKNREITKIYWAIVEGKVEPKEQRLVHFLRKDSAQNKTIVSENGGDLWQRAELSYKLLENSERYSLLEVELYTGRHHQIRAQLSHIGHPIKGDVKYGAKRSEQYGAIFLHARKVSFIHPVSKIEIDVCAELYNSLYMRILEKK